MLLIDDDQAQVVERKEQGRARARHHPNLAFGRPTPDAGAAARRQLGMPFGGRGAKAFCKAVPELRGQRDLGHQDQHLPARGQNFGDRLEIDLGLARTGHALQQDRLEFLSSRRLAQDRGGLGLIVGELGAAEIGVRGLRGKFGPQRHRLERAVVDQGVDDARRHARDPRQFRLGQRDVGGQRRQRAPPRFGQARRRRASRAQSDAHRLRPSLDRRMGGHAQHHAARRERPGGHPVEKIAHFLRQRRKIQPRFNSFEICGATGAQSPDDAIGFARPERNLDEIA